MKKNLSLSIMTIAILACLLVSGTFALFTDTVNLKGNSVSAGSVKIDATLVLTKSYSQLPVAGAENALLDSTTIAVTDNKIVMDNIVPGDVGVFELTITNSSTVAIQYIIGAIPNTADKSLYSALLVTGGLTFNDTVPTTGWQLLSPNINPEAIEFTIALPISAGNEFQNTSFGFDIVVYAVQSNGVTDVKFATTVEEINQATMGQTVILSGDILSEEVINITTVANIDFNNHKITAKSVTFSDENYNGTILFEKGFIVSTDGNIILNYPLATGTLQNMSFTVPSANEVIKGNFSTNTLNIGENVSMGIADSELPATLSIGSNTTVRIQGKNNAVNIKIPADVNNIKIVDERTAEAEQILPEIKLVIEKDESTPTDRVLAVETSKDNNADVKIEGNGKGDLILNDEVLPLIAIGNVEYATIDLAIAAANDEDIIDVSGKHIFTSIFTINKNITLNGLKNAEFEVNVASGWFLTLNKGTVQNIDIYQDEKIDGANSGTHGIMMTSSVATVKGCKISNFRTGIHIQGTAATTAVKILNNTIVANRTGMAILLTNKEQVGKSEIKNNIISDNRTFGILLGNDYSPTTSSYTVAKFDNDKTYTDFLSIENNDIYGNWFAEFENRTQNAIALTGNYWGVNNANLITGSFASETKHPEDGGGAVITKPLTYAEGKIYQPSGTSDKVGTWGATYPSDFEAGTIELINNAVNKVNA